MKPARMSLCTSHLSIVACKHNNSFLDIFLILPGIPSSCCVLEMSTTNYQMEVLTCLDTKIIAKMSPSLQMSSKYNGRGKLDW